MSLFAIARTRGNYRQGWEITDFWTQVLGVVRVAVQYPPPAKYPGLIER
jgi:hypothetical protein